jgi:hypothetical protein
VLYLRHRLGGLGGASTRSGWQDVDAYPEFKAAVQAQAAAQEVVTNTDFLPAAVGAVSYLDPAAVEGECADFRAALDGLEGRYAEAFLTAPSPGIIGSIVQNRFYDTEEAYLAALGAALRVEYQAIVRAGFLLQVDCPDLALERHCSYRDRPLADFLAFCERVASAINAALTGIPRERVRLHVCWGNYEGPHHADVPLRDILPAIRQAEVGGFVLPFANPRHAHEYRVFEELPLAEDQVLVAGVIDTLTNIVEHPQVVADRIARLPRSWATRGGSWPARIAGSTPRLGAAAWRVTCRGPSSARSATARGSRRSGCSAGPPAPRREPNHVLAARGGKMSRPRRPRRRPEPDASRQSSRGAAGYCLGARPPSPSVMVRRRLGAPLRAAFPLPQEVGRSRKRSSRSAVVYGMRPYPCARFGAPPTPRFGLLSAEVHRGSTTWPDAALREAPWARRGTPSKAHGPWSMRPQGQTGHCWTLCPPRQPSPVA